MFLQSSSVIDLSVAVVTATTQTYSGSAKTPIPTVTLNGNTVPSSGYDVTYSNNTNAGTATITVAGKGDYTGTAYGTFTINKATPTYTAPTARSLTYSGSAQYLTTTGSTSHGAIQYSNDGTNWYTTRIQGTNAGSYTTYWRLIGDSNHNDIASTSISVTIAQATGSVTTAPSARDVTYTGSSQYLVTSGSGTGTIYYRYKLSTSSSWSSWSTTRPSMTNAGTYNIEYYAAASSDGNYAQSATGSLNVEMKKAASSVSAAPTAKSLTYSRGSQSLVNAGTASGGTMYYYATTTNSKPSSTSSFSSSIPTKTSAGTYYVWYYVKGDSNHTDTAISSTSVSVTISKATPVISTAPSKRTGLSYTGSAQNLLSGGSVKHSSSDSTSVNGTFTYAQGTNAGTYSSLTWSFTPTDTTNYNTTSGTVSGSVSIAKANRTLSFADTVVAVDPSGNVTKIATPSAGSGDGAITYTISSTTYATINSSTGKVTAKTTEGKATVTANIAAGTNYNSASASYTLYVFATVHNFDYTGTAKNVTLPPGTYKMECWGAQGGSSASDSTYNMPSVAGGKGGHSYGTLVIDSEQTVQVVVGGQGTATTGGYNGGGTSTGTCQYGSSATYGITHMAGGGGATDIRLSSGDLLSRMIVAGGGSGGLCFYVNGNITQIEGYAGGGVNSLAGESASAAGIYWAGRNASFGQGANQTNSSYPYAGAAGGGGWYGGGGGTASWNNYELTRSGGGSGWINRPDMAKYKPSGYTGLDLTSNSSTSDGTQTFVSPSGTNETGHSGNGYARIKRL